MATERAAFGSYRGSDDDQERAKLSSPRRGQPSGPTVVPTDDRKESSIQATEGAALGSHRGGRGRPEPETGGARDGCRGAGPELAAVLYQARARAEGLRYKPYVRFREP